MYLEKSPFCVPPVLASTPVGRFANHSGGSGRVTQDGQQFTAFVSIREGSTICLGLD